MQSNVLITWIGDHDFWGMANALGGATAESVYENVGPPQSTSGGGPIKTLIDSVQFREVHLIANRHQELVSEYRRWIGLPAQMHPVVIEDPTNYCEVFREASRVFETVNGSLENQDQLCVHLSSGTSTMAAVSVLLAKTRFPGDLYQTYRDGRTRKEELPFDVVLDCIPELLRDTDRNLHQLMSRVPSEVKGFEGIGGKSEAIKLAVGRSLRVAIRDVNVLLLGESGTGKELFARAIHRASSRGKDDPNFEKFVAVNCAAIPETLFEGELFGIRKGAFTGATVDRVGKFEAADKGTLFLDEVGECSLENQAKLLRAIQPYPGDLPCDRHICPIGDTKEKKVNVRIVAATNRDLLGSFASRGFRDDLYYRLATLTVELPPLRKRPSDIGFLAEDILKRINKEFQKTEKGYAPKRLTSAAVSRLSEHDWPGNVRELVSVLYEVAIMQFGEEIGREVVEHAIHSKTSDAAQGPLSRQRGKNFHLPKRLKEIEWLFIEDALEETKGNQTQAAKMLGISQQMVNRRLPKGKKRSS